MPSVIIPVVAIEENVLVELLSILQILLSDMALVFPECAALC